MPHYRPRCCLCSSRGCDRSPFLTCYTNGSRSHQKPLHFQLRKPRLHRAQKRQHLRRRRRHVLVQLRARSGLARDWRSAVRLARRAGRLGSGSQDSSRDGDGPGAGRKAGDEREPRCAADGAMPRSHRHGRTSVGPANKKANPEGLAFLLGDAGSPTWARTRDLRINSPALYRLSYRGITFRQLSLQLAVPWRNTKS